MKIWDSVYVSIIRILLLTKNIFQLTVLFRFEYTSCFRETLKNEGAFVTLFSLPEHLIHNKTSSSGCFGEKDGATRYLKTRVPITREFDNAMTVFTYKVLKSFLLKL